MRPFWSFLKSHAKFLKVQSILGDPGVDSGGEGKSKRAEKHGTKKSAEKSPWRQCLTRPVPNGRRRSAFWLSRKTQKFPGTNHNIPQCSELKLLGVIFQYNCKYASNVRKRLVKAGLHVRRTLRRERYNQQELDYLFQSIVMPNFLNFLYGLSVYGASSSDLNNVQHFLDRCYKRSYMSRKLNIRKLLERSDCRSFRKALRTNSPLVKILPEKKFTNYPPRKPCFYHPILATESFKSSYVNRLIFSYDINCLM